MHSSSINVSIFFQWSGLLENIQLPFETLLKAKFTQELLPCIYAVYIIIYVTSWTTAFQEKLKIILSNNSRGFWVMELYHISETEASKE